MYSSSGWVTFPLQQKMKMVVSRTRRYESPWKGDHELVQVRRSTPRTTKTTPEQLRNILRQSRNSNPPHFTWLPAHLPVLSTHAFVTIFC